MSDIITEPEVEAAVNGDLEDQSRNLMDEIRKARRNLAENRQTYIQLPGYEHVGLVAQYHLLDGKQLDMIAERVKRQTKDRVDRGINAAVDTFIAACDGLFVEKDGGYAPLDPDNRGMPLRYEPSLAKFCDFYKEGMTARQVVFGLFGDNDAAIAGHAMKLNRWFMNTTSEVDDEFLGEI